MGGKLLVVGSVALDTVQDSLRRRDRHPGRVRHLFFHFGQLLYFCRADCGRGGGFSGSACGISQEPWR